MVALVESVSHGVITEVVIHLSKRGFKMGEVRVNLSNFVTVGLMAFVAVWLINRGLTAANMQQYKV